MSKSEIDGAQGPPIVIQTFTDDLQQVIHDVGGQSIGNGIKPSPEQRYAHRLIQCVNRQEKGADGYK